MADPTGPSVGWLGRLPLAAVAFGLGTSYLVVSQLVIRLTEGATVGLTFWPGAGLSFAALVLRPRREWPALLVAVFVAEIASDVWAGYPLDLSVTWGMANTVEPLVGAALVTRSGAGAVDLTRIPRIVDFVALGVVVGPLVGAATGTVTGTVLEGDAVWPRLGEWFVGDAIGVLVVAPVLVTSAANRGLTRLAVAPLLALTVLAVVALGPWSFAGQIGLPYLVGPAIVFVALRADPHWAVRAVLAVALVTEVVTARDAGPFGSGPFQGLVLAQLFLAETALMSMVVSALARQLVERTETATALRALALRDELTGLANRRLLADRLHVALRHLQRADGLLAVAVIDLDGFKAVNDTYGHASGDSLLVDRSHRLRQIVRAGDTVARVGGDEFVVVADGVADLSMARALARRLHEAASAAFWLGRERVDVGASVGLVVTDDATRAGDELLVLADAAMYAAKRGGTGYSVLTPGLSAERTGP